MDSSGPFTCRPPTLRPMCLSVPAKVLSVHGDRAIVESRGRRREVNVAHVRARPGGFVLVQGGVAMSVLEPLEAAEIIDAWDELEDVPHA